jgi:hypothetical protein
MSDDTRGSQDRPDEGPVDPITGAPVTPDWSTPTPADQPPWPVPDQPQWPVADGTPTIITPATTESVAPRPTSVDPTLPSPPQYGTPGVGLPGVAGWGAVPQAPKPGVVPLRPLGLGEILDGAISYIRRDPKTVLGVSALIATAIAILQLFLYASFGAVFDRLLSDPAFTSPSSGATPDTASLATGLGAVGVVALLVVVVSFLLNVLATGMLTTAMGQAVLGRPVSTRDVWERARRRFWPLLGLTLLVGLALGGVWIVGFGVAVGIGFLLGQVDTGLGVLVGGVLVLGVALVTAWLTIKLLLAPVALVLESVGPTMAMRRSYRLVTGAWWRTFGIYLLASILAYIVAQVLAIPFSIVGGLIGSTQASSGDLANPFTLSTSIAGALATLVSQTVVIPFTAGIVALLYIDRRIRREALDIELARAAGVSG